MTNILATYNRYPLTLERGEGSYVWDSEEKRYIDLVAGIAVNNLGHCHPELLDTLRQQSKKLWHVSNLYQTKEGEMAAQSLCTATGFDRVFFCNSGAEANEALFKLARRNGQVRLGGAQRIIALQQSFHGRTAAAMSLTGQARIHDGFGDLIPDVEHIAPNDKAALQAAFDASVPCAVLFEPILAEGGGIELDRGFVELARSLCNQHGSLLMFDEVQTGVGRLGTVLGHTNLDVHADAVSLAKGLAGGFPAGAMLVRNAHTELLGAGQHATTFGGGLLAAALITKVIELVAEKKFLTHVQLMGAVIQARLRLWEDKGWINNSFGRGLWWIFEPKSDAIELEKRIRERNILVLPTQSRLRRSVVGWFRRH